MNFFDNEEEIIDWFQTTVDHSEVFFPLCTDDAIRVFEAVHNQEKWTKWKNSSGKDAPPPDFYSDEYGWSDGTMVGLKDEEGNVGILKMEDFNTTINEEGIELVSMCITVKYDKPE